VTWIANTNQGRMVGDYTSTSFTADGKAHPVFSWAKAVAGGAICSESTPCRQRLASATFDITAVPIAEPVRSETEKAARKRARVGHLKARLPTAN
jgi:hypothetical protein